MTKKSRNFRSHDTKNEEMAELASIVAGNNSSCFESAMHTEQIDFIHETENAGRAKRAGQGRRRRLAVGTPPGCEAIAAEATAR
ncbi:MAG: hypothetical protein M0009_05370 [Deltaproteobacteria bacterium]|nr:hypothetical protein [Deltaproteobacteria bacterium]